MNLKQYNQFDNLDSLSERLVHLLFNDKLRSDQRDIERIENLRRLLIHRTKDCLMRPAPTWTDIKKVIDDDGTGQNTKQIFIYPYVEQVALDDTIQYRIYVNEILPVSSYIAHVNMSIDILSHNKNLIVLNPLYRDDETTPLNPTELNPIIQYKNRLEMMEKLTLQLLNGQEVAGIGPLDFSREKNKFIRAKMGLWNNRQFIGHRIIIPVMMGIEFENVS